jgi:hypothetical protein
MLLAVSFTTDTFWHDQKGVAKSLGGTVALCSFDRFFQLKQQLRIEETTFLLQIAEPTHRITERLFRITIESLPLTIIEAKRAILVVWLRPKERKAAPRGRHVKIRVEIDQDEALFLIHDRDLTDDGRSDRSGRSRGLVAQPAKRRSDDLIAPAIVRQRNRIWEARSMERQPVDEHGTTPIFSQLRRRSG